MHIKTGHKKWALFSCFDSYGYICPHKVRIMLEDPAKAENMYKSRPNYLYFFQNHVVTKQNTEMED